MLKRLLNWFKQSNRHIHAKYGVLVWLFMIATGLTLHITCFPSAVMALAATAAVMIGVECKDKQQGGMYDLNDILAGTIIPAVLTILIYFL